MTKLTKMNNRPKKEEFFIHFKAIMPSVLGKTESQVVNHIQLFRKPGLIVRNKPILELLLKSLVLYKLKAAAHIVPIEANLIKPNIAVAYELERKIAAMLENITNSKDDPEWQS